VTLQNFLDYIALYIGFGHIRCILMHYRSRRVGNSRFRQRQPDCCGRERENESSFSDLHHWIDFNYCNCYTPKKDHSKRHSRLTRERHMSLALKEDGFPRLTHFFPLSLRQLGLVLLSHLLISTNI
jgi:hypothetical protein